MERVCLVFAILIQGTGADADGCIADPGSSHGCHREAPGSDATSLLQRHELKMTDRAQAGSFAAKTPDDEVPPGYENAVLVKSGVDDNKCLDYYVDDDENKGNVYAYDCHDGPNQKWYFKGDSLMAQYENGEEECLDYYVASGENHGNVYMGKCHFLDNQKWRLDKGRLKSFEDEKCLARDEGSNNVRMKDCTESSYQKWTFDFAAIDCALSEWSDWTDCSESCGAGSRSRSRTVTTEAAHGGNECDETMDSEGECNVEQCPVDCTMSDWADWSACTATCGDSKRSRSRTVTMEASFGGNTCGELEQVKTCNVQGCPAPLKTREDSKCLDYEFNTGNVYMHKCHGGTNQQWFLDEKKRLTSQYDKKCLDYYVASGENHGNVYMGDCHGGNNQKWSHEGSHIQSEYDDKCLDYATKDHQKGNVHHKKGNVYMNTCHSGNNQKWYFES